MRKIFWKRFPNQVKQQQCKKKNNIITAKLTNRDMRKIFWNRFPNQVKQQQCKKKNNIITAKLTNRDMRKITDFLIKLNSNSVKKITLSRQNWPIGTCVKYFGTDFLIKLNSNSVKKNVITAKLTNRDMRKIFWKRFPNQVKQQQCIKKKTLLRQNWPIGTCVKYFGTDFLIKLNSNSVKKKTLLRQNWPIGTLTNWEMRKTFFEQISKSI